MQFQTRIRISDETKGQAVPAQVNGPLPPYLQNVRLSPEDATTGEGGQPGGAGQQKTFFQRYVSVFPSPSLRPFRSRRLTQPPFCVCACVGVCAGCVCTVVHHLDGLDLFPALGWWRSCGGSQSGRWCRTRRWTSGRTRRQVDRSHGAPPPRVLIVTRPSPGAPTDELLTSGCSKRYRDVFAYRLQLRLRLRLRLRNKKAKNNETRYGTGVRIGVHGRRPSRGRRHCHEGGPVPGPVEGSG